MTQKRRYDMVIFDVGGTLVGFEDDAPFGEVLARIDPPHRFTSANELRLSMLHTLSARRHEAIGMVDDNEINNWWRTIFEELFPGNPAAAMHMWELFKHSYFDSLFPDTLPTLRRFQELGVGMGIVSNYGAHLIYTLYKLNIYDYFKFVIVSSLVGVAKPDRGIFEIAIEKAGVPPNRILYVGDNVTDDIDGSHNAGLDAILINRPGRNPSTAPLVIDSLLELERFVFPDKAPA
ncbi:MAG: HAD family hydrolase [Anaerolineae bacterium]|nr:HAD family hydrolase [Anaerolineae bacterium]